MTGDTSPSLLYLWDKRTIYLGPLFEPVQLSVGAATLVIPLGEPISFITKEMDQAVLCHSLLLPAGMTANIDTNSTVVANISLDALGGDFYALSKRMQHTQGKAAYGIVDEEKYIQAFKKLQTEKMPSQQAYEFTDTLLSCEDESYNIDNRVVKVVEYIKKTVDDNLSVEDLASSVNLSVPRLIQLFKQQTGVPMRRYRLWHRLFVTAVKMGQGESLTQAALSAGFTDSSHFSHTFRGMIGMTPSAIFAQPNLLEIIVSDN